MAIQKVGSGLFMPSISYSRRGDWKVKLNDTNTNRNTIVTPRKLWVEINDESYFIDSSIDLDVNDSSNWDTTVGTDYTVASNRAGVDLYIYAVTSTGSTYASIILSSNDSVPVGYTTSNSRKLGGFHGLCTSTGVTGTDLYSYVNFADDTEIFNNIYSISPNIATNDTLHWLDGYVAGDILPLSLWDQEHRPSSNPEGMVYDAGTNLWVDIYFASWDGSRLVSADGGTIADGASTPAFHKAKFGQHFARQKKRLPVHDEFQSLSLGSPQGVNISGSADPGTTGGHTATNSERIVSLIGVEDATGVLWQWGNGQASASRSTWEDGYTAEDDNVAGKDQSDPDRPRFGGSWDDGTRCGSRSASWRLSALTLGSDLGARGVAEPYGGRA